MRGHDSVEWLARATDFWESWGPDLTAWTHNTRLPDVTLSASMWLPDYVWSCLLLHLATSASAIILHHTSLDAPIGNKVLLITFADTKILEELVKVRIFWSKHRCGCWWRYRCSSRKNWIRSWGCRGSLCSCLWHFELSSFVKMDQVWWGVNCCPALRLLQNKMSQWTTKDSGMMHHI